MTNRADDLVPVLSDRHTQLAGLWPGAWAAECGGPRRQKSAQGGVALGAGDRLVATTRRTDEWNVMFVARDPGELYLQGANNPGAPPRGWIERIDPISLEPIHRSPDLPAGGHTWPGAAVVTHHGDLLVVNGRWLYRLDPHSLEITAALELPADAPHNGIVPLHDGTYVTKDLRLEEPSTLVVVDHDLSVLAQVVLSEPAMGRVAADPHPDGTDIYLPGDRHVLRCRWNGSDLQVSTDWRPRYREPGRGGLGWDTCLAGNRVWLVDNGDIPAVRQVHATHPTGIEPLAFGPVDAWSDPLTATGIATADATDVIAFQPFPDAAGGWVIAPPTFDQANGQLLVHDTGNARVASFAFDEAGGVPCRRWDIDCSMWMQPLLFPETGEIIVNQWDADGDHVAVLDGATGNLKGRVQTGADWPNGMFLTPGWDRDVYYATFDTIARVHAE